MDSKSIARKALEIGAIKLDTKKFFRGRKFEKPVFHDFGLFLSTPQDRMDIRNSFVELLSNNVNDYDIFTTISTQGLVLTTSLADYLRKEIIFLKNENLIKGYRLKFVKYNSIKNKKVIIVDDRVDKGIAIIKAATTIRNSEAICNTFISIFDYGYQYKEDIFSGKEAFNLNQKIDPPLYSLSLFNLDTLLEVAVGDGYINSEGKEKILLWRDNCYKREAAHYPPISRYP